jgi:hypothetical protein
MQSQENFEISSRVWTYDECKIIPNGDVILISPHQTAVVICRCLLSRSFEGYTITKLKTWFKDHLRKSCKLFEKTFYSQNEGLINDFFDTVHSREFKKLKMGFVSVLEAFEFPQLPDGVSNSLLQFCFHCGRCVQKSGHPHWDHECKGSIIDCEGIAGGNINPLPLKAIKPNLSIVAKFFALFPHEGGDQSLSVKLLHLQMENTSLKSQLQEALAGNLSTTTSTSSQPRNYSRWDDRNVNYSNGEILQSFSEKQADADQFFKQDPYPNRLEGGSNYLFKQLDITRSDPNELKKSMKLVSIKNLNENEKIIEEVAANLAKQLNFRLVDQEALRSVHRSRLACIGGKNLDDTKQSINVVSKSALIVYQRSFLIPFSIALYRSNEAFREYVSDVFLTNAPQAKDAIGVRLHLLLLEESTTKKTINFLWDTVLVGLCLLARSPSEVMNDEFVNAEYEGFVQNNGNEDEEDAFEGDDDASDEDDSEELNATIVTGKRISTCLKICSAARFITLANFAFAYDTDNISLSEFLLSFDSPEFLARVYKLSANLKLYNPTVQESRHTCKIDFIDGKRIFNTAQGSFEVNKLKQMFQTSLDHLRGVFETRYISKVNESDLQLELHSIVNKLCSKNEIVNLVQFDFGLQNNQIQLRGLFFEKIKSGLSSAFPDYSLIKQAIKFLLEFREAVRALLFFTSSTICRLVDLFRLRINPNCPDDGSFRIAGSDMRIEINSTSYKHPKNLENYGVMSNRQSVLVLLAFYVLPDWIFENLLKTKFLERFQFTDTNNQNLYLYELKRQCFFTELIPNFGSYFSDYDENQTLPSFASLTESNKTTFLEPVKSYALFRSFLKLNRQLFGLDRLLDGTYRSMHIAFHNALKDILQTEYDNHSFSGRDESNVKELLKDLKRLSHTQSDQLGSGAAHSNGCEKRFYGAIKNGSTLQISEFQRGATQLIAKLIFLGDVDWTLGLNEHVLTFHHPPMADSNQQIYKRRFAWEFVNDFRQNANGVTNADVIQKFEEFGALSLENADFKARDQQAHVVNQFFLSNNDLWIRAGPGVGKTSTMILSSGLLSDGIVVVIVPTISLCQSILQDSQRMKINALEYMPSNEAFWNNNVASLKHTKLVVSVMERSYGSGQDDFSTWLQHLYNQNMLVAMIFDEVQNLIESISFRPSMIGIMDFQQRILCRAIYISGSLSRYQLSLLQGSLAKRNPNKYMETIATAVTLDNCDYFEAITVPVEIRSMESLVKYSVKKIVDVLKNGLHIILPRASKGTRQSPPKRVLVIMSFSVELATNVYEKFLMEVEQDETFENLKSFLIHGARKEDIDEAIHSLCEDDSDNIVVAFSTSVMGTGVNITGVHWVISVGGTRGLS